MELQAFFLISYCRTLETFVGPYLGHNCLRRLSDKDKSRQRCEAPFSLSHHSNITCSDFICSGIHLYVLLSPYL